MVRIRIIVRLLLIGVFLSWGHADAKDDQVLQDFKRVLALTRDALSNHFLVAKESWKGSEEILAKSSRDSSPEGKQLAECWPPLRVARQKIVLAHQKFLSVMRPRPDAPAILQVHRVLLNDAKLALDKAASCFDNAQTATD